MSIVNYLTEGTANAAQCSQVLKHLRFLSAHLFKSNA